MGKAVGADHVCGSNTCCPTQKDARRLFADCVECFGGQRFSLFVGRVGNDKILWRRNRPNSCCSCCRTDANNFETAAHSLCMQCGHAGQLAGLMWKRSPLLSRQYVYVVCSDLV